MANSSNVHVGPRRLSKPRTNNSFLNLLSEQPPTPSSPRNSSDQDYFGKDAVIVNSHGERRSRSKSRSRIRAYLYGPSHDALQTSSDEEEPQTGVANAAREVKKRLSRTGSSITPLQSAKASATRLSNSSTLGLLSTCSTESQGLDPEKSAMIADQIKQRAYHDSLAAKNHVSVDEDRHVDSFMAPLRRKSLYTPGIATRNASDILRKPPKPTTDHDYYYYPSRPAISPLSHLATLNVSEDGRSTPCDLHYAQLGGLQLGTLRVTNGASSPGPSDRPPDSSCRSATPESKTHDEFYTASEGSVTGDGDHATPLTLRAGSPLKHESKPEASMQTDNPLSNCPDESLSFERESYNESFPFSRETVDQTARFENGTSNQSARFGRENSYDIISSEEATSYESLPFKRTSSIACPIEAAKTNGVLPLEMETHIKAFSIEHESSETIKHFEKKPSNHSFPLKMEILKPLRVVEETPIERTPSNSVTREELVRFRGPFPNDASNIADEYIAELETSPFSRSMLQKKRDLITQSQHPTEELWSPPTNNAELHHLGNGSGSRDDALRGLTVKGSMPSTWQAERLSTASSHRLRYSASPEMTHTDSGYCSYASLTVPPTHEVCFEAGSSGSSPTPSAKASASNPPRTVETVRFSARSSFRVPLRKLQKQRPKSQPSSINLVTGYHELTDANIPRIPSIIAARHAKRFSQFPLLEHTSPALQHTTADRTLSPVQAHDAPIRFPSPANALEAASASLRSFLTASKPQASTIVNEGDGFSASDLVRSPSWSEYGGGRRRKEQKKLDKEEKANDRRLLKEEKELERRLQKDRKDLEKQIWKDGNRQRSTRSRSASRTRARSSEGQSRYDTLLKIADFGTVTECLGNSPYDIATSTFTNLQNAKNWHPYQISTAMPRPKSSFGARYRSQTIFLDMPSVPALAAVDLKSHNLEWARDRQRSQSSSAAGADSLDDRGGIPGISVRPHSAIIEETPPLPALPSAQQVKKREAEIIRSRPHSMIVDTPVPTPTSQQSKGRRAVACSSESGARSSPRKTKGSKIVPDLWSNGSLERKSPKMVDRSEQAPNDLTREIQEALPGNDNLWETQSQAWSQRRESADQTLLANEARDVSVGQKAANSAPPHADSDRPVTLVRASSSVGAYETFTPTPSHLGPFPNPLALHTQLTAQQPTSTLNTLTSYNLSTVEQIQRLGFGPLALTPVLSASSFHHAEQRPESPQRFVQTQPFQIRRKRVGSGPSMTEAETATAIESSQCEGVLV